MTTTMTTKHIWIVAHDFSPAADEAARLAVRDLAAQPAGGVVLLCHIYRLMPLPTGVDGPSLVGLEREIARESEKQLEKFASALRTDTAALHGAVGKSNVDVEVVVRQDAPAEGVLAEAKDRGATRIFTGSHGRRGFAHFLLGSVAERIVRLADVPVVVVKGRNS